MIITKGAPDGEPPKVRLRQFPQLFRQAMTITWAAGRGELVAAMILQLVGAVGLAGLLLIGRGAVQEALAAIEDEASLTAVLPWVLAFAGVAAAQATVSAVRQERQLILSEKVTRYVQGRVLDVTSEVDLAMFDDPDFHNRAQRTRHGGHKLSLVMVQGLLGLMQSVLGVIAGLVVIAALAPVLLPLIGLVFVPAWLSASRRGETFHAFFWKSAHDDRQREYIVSLLQQRDSAKEVRAFALAPHLRRRYEDLYDKRMTELTRLGNRQIRIDLVANLMVGAVLAVVLLIVAWMALDGGVPLVSAGVAMVAAAMVGQRLAGVGRSVGSLGESARHLDDYLTFDALLPQVREGRPTGPPPPGFSTLSASDVHFRYPAAGEPALCGISLEIRAGEVVALVGENGSGKTTLAKLLAGLYHPDRGTIRWDGVDMSTVDPDAWRDRVAVIFQDFERFRLTARENIGFGRLADIDDRDAVQAAARQAGAAEFIEELPDAYETPLGPEFTGGTDLSVGQWQRIALARAFFRGAPVIILDEPTAALDPRAEQELFDRIRTLLAGRTVLLISHRFSSVRSADRIYVLDGGRVVESGDHHELMGVGGLYADLFTLQAAAYVE
jgi:ATP-binding cassette, subfamily B, bacterial